MTFSIQVPKHRPVTPIRVLRVRRLRRGAHKSISALMIISNLQIDTVLSTGSFGIVVYKSRLKDSMINYAVKRIPRAAYEASQERIRGIRFLRQMCADRHPHILHLAAAQASEHHVWVVYEYCAGGSLMQLLMAEGTLIMPACKVKTHKSKGKAINSQATKKGCD